MTARDITVAEDETFHPAICLVGIEVVSGFLLVETYAAHRDAATWDAALKQALEGLPLTVVCQVGDEAKGLLAHAKNGLGVPHSPDLFHVQQELSRAVGPALASQTRTVAGHVLKAEERLAVAQTQRLQAAVTPPSPGRPIDHDARVQAAEQLLAGTRSWMASCQQRQAQAREAIRGLGDDDHPFALSSGAAQEAEQVRERLESRLATLESLAAEAKLSKGCRERLAKARRVLPGLVAAVAFFWTRVRLATAATYGEAWRVGLDPE